MFPSRAEDNEGTPDVYLVRDMICLRCGHEWVGIIPIKAALGYSCRKCGMDYPDFEWVPITSGPDTVCRDEDELDLLAAFLQLRRDYSG